jgi:hypothetical protein
MKEQDSVVARGQHLSLHQLFVCAVKGNVPLDPLIVCTDLLLILWFKLWTKY